MTDDQSLGDTTAPSGDTPFGNPNGARAVEPTPMRMLSVEDVLASARLPEKRARICLRADLQAEHDDIVAELATLVDAQGQLLEDDEEASIGETSTRDRVIELNERLTGVRRKMSLSMWFPLFRGLDSTALAVFNKKNYPKGDGADLTEYNNLLIAECAVAPTMTVEEIKALRGKLGSKAIGSIVTTVHEVCLRGGVDIPKLPVSLVNLTQQ